MGWGKSEVEGLPRWEREMYVEMLEKESEEMEKEVEDAKREGRKNAKSKNPRY